MASIPRSILPLLQFYRSAPQPCPYIAGQIEQKLFTQLPEDAAIGKMANSTLSRAGFRRSHSIVYRPFCPNCQACVPVRVPVQQFHPSRTQRRLQKALAELCWQAEAPIFSTEHFALFQSYEKARHSDSDMANMQAHDFRNMLEEGSANTQLFTLRDSNGQLLGSIMTDVLDDGFSAVYSYFATTTPHDGLGTGLILSLIAEAQRRDLPYVYLGYWIKESVKMAYKGNFRPFERLGPHGWAPATDEK